MQPGNGLNLLRARAVLVAFAGLFVFLGVMPPHTYPYADATAAAFAVMAGLFAVLPVPR